MKTTRLEDDLVFIAQVEMALDKGHTLSPDMIRQLRLMMATAYSREHAWTIGFFTSLLVNVMLLMAVFL